MVILVCFGFALLRLVIGLKNSRHFLSQSEVEPKPIVRRSRTFSPASHRRHVFASSVARRTGLPVLPVLGQFIYFGFGFRHSVENRRSRLPSPLCVNVD